MPAIDTVTGGGRNPRRRRRRPAAAAPVRHAPTHRAPVSTPHNADTGDPARARPIVPRRRTPAFQPIGSQGRPFTPQRNQAVRRTTRARSRLGNPRYATKPTPAPPPFRIDPKRVALAPPFRPPDSQARPFRVQRSRIRAPGRAARNRFPDHPAIPEVKGLYLQSDLDKLDSAYKRARLKAARGDVSGARRDYDRARRELANQTPDELISRIRKAYKTAAQSLGGRNFHDLYQFGSLRQRRQMKHVAELVKSYESANTQQVAAERGQTPEAMLNQDRVSAPKRPVALAGIPVGRALHSAARYADEHTRIPGRQNASLQKIASVPYQLARATAEDPEAVARNSVRTAVESIGGIPEGVKQIVSDPKGALHATVKDYEKRYGPILTDPEKFRKQVKEDTGLTPFILDAASLGVPVGRAATLLMRSGAAGRAVAALARVSDKSGRLRPLSDFADAAHKAARAPRDARRLASLESELKMAELEGDTARQAELGRAIHHARGNVRATERPALRFSGGEGGVRKQHSSSNLIIGLGQRGLDRTRRRSYGKTVNRAGWALGVGGRLMTGDVAPRARTVDEARISSERLAAESLANPKAGAQFERDTRARTVRLSKRRPKTGIIEFEHLFARKIDRDIAQARRLGLHETADHLGKLADEVRQVASLAGRAASRAGHESAAQRVLMEHWGGDWRGPAPKALKRGQVSHLERIGALRPGDREVLPKTSGVVGRSVRELPGMRRYTGRVARDLGEQQSVTRLKLLTHRGRVVHAVDKALKRLDPDEQASMKYMLQLGATPDAAGIRVLYRRRAQIMAARTEHRTRISSVLEDSNDELALINRILDDPAKHLTPRARAVADELRAIQLREARQDPELTSAQELIRRVTPQGKTLGVERGPDVEFFRGVLREIEDDTGVSGIAAHADELASLHPSERAARAKELLAPVKRQRKQAERDVETARRRLAVAKERVRQSEKRGVPFDTEAVREARRDLARAKRARRAIGEDVTRAERRAGLLTGRLGEREARGAPLATPEVRDARREVAGAQRRLNALESKLPPAERRAGRRIGEATGRETRGRNMRALGAELASGQLEDQIARARQDLRDAQTRLADVERNAPRITPAQYRDQVAVGSRPDELRGRLNDAEQAALAARQRLDQALAEAPRVTDAEARAVRIRTREEAASRATREHVRDFEKALKKVVRASKKERNMRLEDAESFAARVKDAAEAEGLAAPAYWWSSLAPKEMPSLAAAGKGLRAAHGNKAYKGKLFDIGAEEHGVDVFSRGVERNIKRRFQQALVARNLETHAYEWSKGVHGAGLTISELEKAMIDRAIDPKTVELVDPRILRKRATELEGTERGRVMSPDEIDPETTMLPEELSEEDFVSTTQQDLAESRRRWKEVSHDELARQAQHRFLVVPREVGETLDGLASHMDNKFWRGMEIVLKQKPARILLGAANVPWLAFQVASNGLLTGIGGGINPFDVWGAHKWWRGLGPEEREAVEAELGITHGHHFGMDQPNLGATNNRMVNFWRAYKKTRVGRIGHTINPLNLMFRADEAQNNFFRKVLFYDRSRKAAYRRMGHSWKSIDRLTTRLVDRVLARPPHQQAHLIARHGADFEQVAKHVNDFLGDYTRFTPAERHLLQRNVMFYGYMRFSLRFTFYTMPIAHPIMANILSNIGRLGADEIKRLMGVPENYSLPSSILSQTYFGDRNDAKHNELRSLPLGRFNPFLNALTQLDGGQQAFGVVSPFYQVIADQMFEESSFTGRDWRIGGRPTPSETDRPRSYYGSMANLLNPLAYDLPGHEGKPRNRIAENAILNLAYPYRVASETGIPHVVKPLEPNQSDDALLWRPEPMAYADKDAAKGVEKSRKDYAREGTVHHLESALLPIFPKRTASPAVIARELEREASIRERNKRKPGERKKRKRRASKPQRSYATGSGNSPYGSRRRRARYR